MIKTTIIYPVAKVRWKIFEIISANSSVNAKDAIEYSKNISRSIQGSCRLKIISAMPSTICVKISVIVICVNISTSVYCALGKMIFQRRNAKRAVIISQVIWNFFR